MMEDTSMEMESAVDPQSRNQKYDTVSVDITALPYKSEDRYTRIWLNGHEIRNVKSINISADMGNLTTVSITFQANVTGVDAQPA